MKPIQFIDLQTRQTRGSIKDTIGWLVGKMFFFSILRVNILERRNIFFSVNKEEKPVINFYKNKIYLFSRRFINSIYKLCYNYFCQSWGVSHLLIV